MRIFIGHDSRFPQATKVCRKSMQNYNDNLDITFLEKLENIPLTNYIRLCLT